MKYADFYSMCDTMLRAGEVAPVAKLLSELTLAKVPREWLFEFANLSRRAGQVSLGLKLLSPIMQPDAVRKSSPQEISEYAILLQRCGATRDALRWLRQV